MNNAVVYVIPCGNGKFKIGATKNIAKRYPVKSDRDRVLIAIPAGNSTRSAKQLEKELHRLFRRKRISLREIFRLTESDLKLLKEIETMATESLYMSSDLSEAIDTLAAKERRSFSNMIRQLLIEALNARQIEIIQPKEQS